MSTHQTAKTHYITTPTNTTTYAYRRLGTSPGTPLLILTHFRGVMDKFDPAILNGISAHRPVITLDYAGIGLSTGAVATTMSQNADHVLEFLSLVGVKEVDVLGFSRGGMVAQLVALNADPLKVRVRKLVLTGTSPSVGLGVTKSANADVPEWATRRDIDVDWFKRYFFPENREGDAAAEAWWKRVHERTKETSGEGVVADWTSQGLVDDGRGWQAEWSQLEGFLEEETTKGRNGSFERLGGLDIPVLVANGQVITFCP